MFAVVTANKKSFFKSKINFKKYNHFYHFTVNSHCNRSKLLRALSPFGEEYIISDILSAKGLNPYDTSPFRESVLFEVFKKYVLSCKGVGLSVGVYDPYGLYLKRSIDIINHAESTIIFCLQNADDFCHEALKICGICPEIVDDVRWMRDCNCVFAPLGNCHAEVTFGKDGYTLCSDKIFLPQEFAEVVSLGIEPLDIAALLSLSDGLFCAENVSQSITVSKVLCEGDKQRKKDFLLHI